MPFPLPSPPRRAPRALGRTIPTTLTLLGLAILGACTPDANTAPQAVPGDPRRRIIADGGGDEGGYLSPTITFVAPASATAGEPFTLAFTDTASQNAGYTYAFDCGTGQWTASTGTSSISCPTSAVGPLVVRGSVANPYGANRQYTETVEVTATGQASQSVAFTSTPPSPAVVGATYALVASGGGSGNAVVFASAAPAVCTVSGSTATLVAAGTCALTADQAGNAGYSAAPQAAQTFAVSQGTQTVAFTSPAPSPAYVGTTYVARASATSGLAATISAATPAVCTESNGVVTFLAVGTCTLAADQAGSAAYLPAAQATQSVAVTKAPQTVAFTSTPPSPAFVGATYALAATGGGSGSPVTYASLTPAVCGVSGRNATFLAAGTCTVAADQAGSAAYLAAAQATQNVAVTKLPQAITFAPPATAVIGGTLTLRASGGASGAAVTFTALTPSTCSISGGTVTFAAVGACTVAADQDGTAAYEAAPRVTRTIGVVWPFTGFFSPVQNPPVVNVVNAGQAVPLTFALGGARGTAVLQGGAPASVARSCDKRAPTGGVTASAAAGASGLQYDAATGRYTYTWKSEKAWAGTCRQLTLTLVDGTAHTALFQFK